jgi:hypothetical protein
MVGIADGLDASAKHPLCSPVEFNSKQCPPSNVRRLYKTITAVTLSQIFLSSFRYKSGHGRASMAACISARPTVWRSARRPPTHAPSASLSFSRVRFLRCIYAAIYITRPYTVTGS